MSETLDPSLRDLNDCGCGAGTTAQTPVPLDNRDGLDHLAYRVGTHGQFKQSMLAALSEAKHAALRGLGTRADDDFTIALLDGWAAVADVLTFYQERLANESYLRTAIERRSVLELARTVGYELDPGVAAATWLAFMVEPSVEKVRIPKAVKVQSVPGQDEKPQTFETVGEIKEARPEWNVLKPKLTKPQTLLPFDMKALWIAGVNTNLRTGDSLLIMAESAGGGSEAALRRIVTVNADARAGRTELLLEIGTLRITTAYSKSGVWALRVKAAPFGHNVPLKVDVTLNAPNAVVTEVAPTITVPILFTASAKTVNAAGVASTKALASLAPVVRVDTVVKTPAPLPYNGDKVTVPPAALTKEVDIVAHGPDVHLPLPLYSYTPQTNVVEVFNVPDVGVPKTITVTLKDAFVDVTAHPATVDVTTHPSVLTTTPGAVITNRTEWTLEEPDFMRLTLDAVYDRIQTDSWIVVDRPGDPNTPTGRQHIVAGAKQVLTLSRTDYGVAVRATQVLLDQNWRVGADTLSIVRQMVVYAQSEPLALVEQPDETKISGDSIVLDRVVGKLFPGQAMVVSGMDYKTGETANEVVTLDYSADVVTSDYTKIEQRVTKLVFTTTLQHAYQRASVIIYANVGAATHGETVSEILGDGDAGAAYQRFALKQAPLTFTRADTETGKESTLEIWVNDVKWLEVPSLFDRKPNERIYITRLADDGTVTVLFGDGRSGARLPTGAGNIRAVYRKGTGLPGMVRAGQLKTLLTRPLGLRDVISPLPATGADDPESVDDSRRNAPLTVLTMGRVVSLQDYEDYARAYPGIAKALATWTWSGRLRGVMLTVAMAAPAGGDPTDGRDVIPKLLKALREYGNPFVPLRVEAYRPAEFVIAGTLAVQPDHDPDKVLAAARKTLADRYSFSAREFGQPVMLSEVIAVLQAVDGVESLDIDDLQRTDRTDPAHPAQRLLAEFPAPGAEAGVLPAELLTLYSASPNYLSVAP